MRSKIVNIHLDLLLNRSLNSMLTKWSVKLTTQKKGFKRNQTVVSVIAIINRLGWNCRVHRRVVVFDDHM